MCTFSWIGIKKTIKTRQETSRQETSNKPFYFQKLGINKRVILLPPRTFEKNVPSRPELAEFFNSYYMNKIRYFCTLSTFVFFLFLKGN